MKTVTFVLAASLVFGCRSQERREAYNPAVLEEILEGMRKREAGIKDVQCEFSVRSLNPTENTVRGEAFWAYKEGKEYWDLSNFNQRSGKFRWRQLDSFDGEKRYHYEPEKSAGSIGRHDKDLFSGSFTPRTLLCWDLERSVIGFQDVAGYIASSKIVGMQETTVGPDKIYIISAEHKGAPVYEIWINADKDYRIEKLIQYHGPDRKRYLFKVDGIVFENYKGIWFPVEGAKQFGFDQSGKPEHSQRVKVKPGTLKVNEGIADDFFTLNFPEGTRIYDEFAVRKKRARFTGKRAPPLQIAHWFGTEPLTLVPTHDCR
jgi:outer membrane lipoprotein-sorting protein